MKIFATLSITVAIVAISTTSITAQIALPDFANRSEAMKWFLDSYRSQAEGVFKDIIEHAPLSSRRVLKQSSLVFEPEETPFAFYGDRPGLRKIHIALGGLNALDCSASAFSLQLSILKKDDWWLKYLLFHRMLRKQPNTNWLDPLQMMQLSRTDLSDDQSFRLVATWKNVFEDMLTFVIAHEAGHVARGHNGEQRKGESEPHYFKRLRLQEKAADDFALETVSTMDVNPFGVVATLLTHLIVSEDRTLEADHPEDGMRIQHAIDYFARHKAPQDFLRASRGLLSAFQAPGQSAHQALDALASRVTLDELTSARR